MADFGPGRRLAGGLDRERGQRFDERAADPAAVV
jgi:hypothetical protein